MHRACGPWQALTKAVCNRPAHRITLLSLALLPFRPTLVFGLHWILLEVQRGRRGWGWGVLSTSKAGKAVPAFEALEPAFSDCLRY